MRASDWRPADRDRAEAWMDRTPGVMPARRRLTAVVFMLVFLAGGAIGLVWLPGVIGPGAAVAQNATQDTGAGSDANAAGAPGGAARRMVSLDSSEVNVRTGPGIRFPVKWVFKRRFMPLEVLAEYETWRKIRDWEGAEGWVHRAMLSARPTVLVIKPEVTMRRAPEETAPAVARLADGMVGRLIGCGEQGWCQIDAAGYEGWVRREGLWGALSGSG
ncbi:hypothetical protein KAJ83_04980 [Marivibrio halodurans]|uniref:SH3-like domain-containing protein n=1 Tax=Marivibrio halodurans TaxID=2039722 RepID=A0A8J7V1H3_9PROT|nr:SH3 domain-containing protein [Marivibrio halodurans]MBP5856350.1 hypothetical protein [Marivibrio halodurans]